MFEYRIQRNGSTINLEPKEIHDILTLNVAREALMQYLTSGTQHATEELALICRHLYNMTTDAVADCGKLLSRIISLTGNETTSENDIWKQSAAKVLNEKAATVYSQKQNRMTLVAVSGSDKKLDSKLRKVNELLEKFMPADVEVDTVSYSLSSDLTLYGLVNRPFAATLKSDPGWKDTLENWMTDILSGDNDKPVVLHMHGGEIYILRGNDTQPLRKPD